MQRPHEDILSRFPAFAALQPALDRAARANLDTAEDRVLAQQLAEVSRTWAKLRIMWDEVQLLLSQDTNAEFFRSVRLHLEQVHSADQFKQHLHFFGIPEDETYIPKSPDMDQRLELLGSMLANALDEKLSVLARIQRSTTTGEDPDLASWATSREETIQEYRTAIEDLRDQINQSMMQLHKECTVTILNHTHYLDAVKHGSLERFTNSYLKYHELATTALLEKLTQSYHIGVEKVYSPTMKEALREHLRQIQETSPVVERRLENVNREIERYDQTRTEEYRVAVAEYRTLKSAVEQAERDVDKLMHYGKQ